MKINFVKSTLIYQFFVIYWNRPIRNMFKSNGIDRFNKNEPKISPTTAPNLNPWPKIINFIFGAFYGNFDN